MISVSVVCPRVAPLPAGIVGLPRRTSRPSFQSVGLRMIGVDKSQT